MQIDLTPDEAQALLDGINVTIKEKEKDVRFWRTAPVPQDTRDRLAGEELVQLQVMTSARRKIQKVR